MAPVGSAVGRLPPPWSSAWYRLVLLLLLSALARDAASLDRPQVCSSDQCQHGGSCFIMQSSLAPLLTSSSESMSNLVATPSRAESDPSPTTATPAARCPPPFLPSGGTCLWLTGNRGSPEFGRQECSRLEGKLASLGAEDGARLARLLHTVPNERYVWAADESWQRQRHPRQAFVRLCRAVQADTGRPVMRHCGENLRSLCERAPLAFPDGRRQVRRRRDLVQSGTLELGQSCHCMEGYGNQTCDNVPDAGGHEKVICDGAQIGEPGNTRIVVDFGYFGRMNFDSEDENIPKCYQPDQPLPKGDPGCMAPTSQTILRYWCQGKETCLPKVSFIAAFTSDSCSPDVTPVLRMRTRTVKQDALQTCLFNGTFYSQHGSCYLVTQDAGRWEDQLQQCREMGGDLAYVPTSQQAAFLQFVSNSLSEGEALWAAGESEEPRPVVDLRSVWYMQNRLTCVSGSAVTQCSEGQLRGLCALPPWTEDSLPPPQPCPERKYQQWTFPETPAGLTARLSCGDGFNPGNASWFCGLDGGWSSPYPDLTDCTSAGIDTNGAREQLENGTQKVSEVINELAANYSQHASSSGDVVNTVQLMPLMVSSQLRELANVSDPAETAHVYMHNITQLVSLLTALRRSSTWMTMPHGARRNSSSSLQLSLQSSAALTADYLFNQSSDFVNFSDEISVRTGRYDATMLNSNSSTRSFRSIGGSSVTLPPEAVPSDGNATLVFAEYTTLGCLLGNRNCKLFELGDSAYPDVVNSPLLTASIGNGSRSIRLQNSTVTIRLKKRMVDGPPAGYRHMGYTTAEPRCVFWVEDDTATSQFWSSEGCVLVSTTNDFVECQCNHLTSFATLFDFRSANVVLDTTLEVLTYLGGALSVLALVLCVLAFSAMNVTANNNQQKPTSINSKLNRVHVHLCLTLLVAEIFLLAGLKRHENESDVACATVAALLHYFLLAAFAWMGIEGFNLYYCICKVFGSSKSYNWYYCGIGYGVPALIVAISLGVATDSYGSWEACWLSGWLIWAFEGPVLVVILGNFVVLAFAVRTISQRNRETELTASHQAKSSEQEKPLKMIRKTAFLMTTLGITWIFGYFQFQGLAGLTDFVVVVFTILNSLQGLFIFLIWIVFHPTNLKQSRKLLHKKAPGLFPAPPDAKVKTATRTEPTTNTSLAGTSNGEFASSDGRTQSSAATSTAEKPPNSFLQVLKRARKNYALKRQEKESLATPGQHQELNRIPSVDPSSRRRPST